MSGIREALRSDDAATRAEAIDALTAVRDVPGLLAALGSRDAHVRQRAVLGLTPAIEPRVLRRLLALRRDRDDRVRLALAEALADRVHGWRVARALRSLARRDASPAVRFAALAAIARLDSPWVDRLLRRAAAGDPAGLVRDAAAALLLRRGAVELRRTSGARRARRDPMEV